jgi:hypothetical protein
LFLSVLPFIGVSYFSSIHIHFFSFSFNGFFGAYGSSLSLPSPPSGSQ